MRTLTAAVVLGLAAAAACESTPRSYGHGTPPPSGCASQDNIGSIDCRQYPNISCVAEGNQCPLVDYGCADGSYWSGYSWDPSCPTFGDAGEPDDGPADATVSGDVGSDAASRDAAEEGVTDADASEGRDATD